MVCLYLLSFIINSGFIVSGVKQRLFTVVIMKNYNDVSGSGTDRWFRRQKAMSLIQAQVNIRDCRGHGYEKAQ